MAVNAQKGKPLDRVYTGVMNIVPGNTQPFDLDVNSLLEEVDFRVTGQLVLANYTTAPTMRVEALENLLASVSFSGNGKNAGTPTVNFSSTDFSYLRRKTAMVEGTEANRVDIGTANGTYNFETNATKYFGVKRIVGFGDSTYLDTRVLQSLKVNVIARGVEAMIKPGSGVAGTAVLSNVVASIHSREWVNGTIIGKAPYVSETQRDFDLTNLGGINVPFKNVPIGNILLRQYFKGTVGDTTYADPSDAIFATTLKSEGPHIQTTVNNLSSKLDMTYPAMQNLDRKTFSLEAWPEGWAVYEYSRTGLIGDTLNLSGSAVTSCWNLLDITPVGGQTNTLQITDEQLITK